MPKNSRRINSSSTTSMVFVPISGCIIFLGMGALHGEETSELRSTTSVSRSNKGSIRSVKDVVFQEISGESVKADLYRPKTDERLPTIIMIHGGAWMTGDKWNVIDHAIQMAESGFVVMAINYRLAPTHRWPAQREDCLAALQWISEHRKEWNADIDRLGVWGYSAGGHLALMIALEQKSDLPPVRACVAGGPPCDLDFIPLKSQMLSAFLGGSREQYPERYRDASPIHLLSPDDPPLYIFHGEEDSIVPIDNSRKFHRKSLELGMANEYRTVSELGHLMTFIDRPSRLDAIDFLKKHLAPASR